MINAGIAAGSGVECLDVTANFSSVDDGLMSAVMGLAVDEEGPRTLRRWRIDGVCPNRLVNSFALGPCMELACNSGQFMKIVRLASGNGKAIVGGGSNGFNEQLLWSVQSKATRIQYGFR